MKRSIRLPCIAIHQGENRRLFTFAIDGKELHSIAQVSRLGRGEDFGLLGYQRPEVQSHIAEIRTYLESTNPLLPNAIVIAFDKGVKFHPAGKKSGISQAGEIEIPVFDDEHERVGWIVDGQQRSAALRDARLSSFPVFVTAFLTDSESDQREQFILVNSTKPLPKGLIYELLPETEAVLSRALEQRRIPSMLLNRLNHHLSSPFRLIIKTPTAPEGYIQDNSVLRMIGTSLHDGALYRIALTTPEQERFDTMIDCLSLFWRSVAEAFPEAWALPPRRSRLSHGVGITSLGHVMDAAYDRHLRTGQPLESCFEQSISVIRPLCAWTSGYWDFGGGMNRKWDEVQNTTKDCHMVASFLLLKLRQSWR